MATEGRIALNNRVIDIIGEAWSTADGTFELSGSKIINTGTDVIDSLVIEIDGEGTTGGKYNGGQLRNLAIEHQDDSFAVRLNDYARHTTHKIAINSNNGGLEGIQYDGASFLSRTRDCFIRNFSEYGIQITGSGNTHYVESCHTHSSGAGAVGVETHLPWTFVNGGQYNVNDADGVGVRFYNPTGDTVDEGFVQGITGEVGRTVLEIDGDTDAFTNVFGGPVFSSAESAVTFGPSVSSKISLKRSSGEAAVWSANSDRDTAVMSYSDAARSYTDNGANLPAIHVTNANLSDAFLSNINTSGGVPVIVPFSTSHNSPVVFDDSDWHTMSTSVFTP